MRRDFEREKREKKAEARQIGARIRKARLSHQLTREQVVQGCTFSAFTLTAYELGSQMPRSARLGEIARAIGCPVAAFFVDELVLAELRVSEETLERIRREGQPAVDEVTARIASTLSALLLAEASRTPVDLRPNARPRKRRDRAQVLAGVAAAKAGSAARKARDAADTEIH